MTLNTATWQPGDTVICKAKATDAYSGSNTSNASVSIGNRLPNITDVAITPNTNVTTTTKLTCVGTGSDPDNSGALTWSYTWRNQTTATILGTGSAFTLTTSDASPFDVIQCKATAVDADSGTADQVATVSVVNSNPVFSSHTISPNSDISTSDELTCAASATDPDNTTVTTSFTWTNKTTSTNMGTGRTLQLTTTNSSPNDEIECTAVATDADSGSTSSTVSVLVGNATPTVDTLSISPSTAVKTNTRLTCTATASDDDGGTPSIVYAWKNVTSSTALGTTSTLLLTNTTASPDDEIECSVTASDIHGGSATSSVRVTVENGAPVITDVTVTPDTGVTTDSVLSCSATATDIDGGTPSFTYEWIKNSTTSLGSGAGLTLDPANVSPGDNVACKATATDADSGTDSATRVVTIINTPPVITSAATITPATGITTSSGLRCDATATDADDATAPVPTYEWFNGTTSIGDKQILTLTTTLAQPDDIIKCVATATDANGTSVTSEDTVTVENTGPNITSVSIDTSKIFTDSTIVCTAVANDPDGGTPTLAYAWTNGTSTIGTAASLTLDNTLVSPRRHHHVYCNRHRWRWRQR